MWSGTLALRNIDQTLQTIRNEVVRLDQQLSNITQELGNNQRHRIKLINDIASVRLSEIEKGELNHALTSADQHALKILKQRETALSQLNADIEQLDNQLSVAETERETRLEQLNSLSQQLVDCEAGVQSSLKQDKSYMAQFQIASQAESVALEAAEKVAIAQADMTKKAEPYQADELFMYLWNRGYGTTEYKGGLFARFMDGWVARVIKYEAARVNYWNLTEIPKRLEEHAVAVQQNADDAHMQLQQLELDALQDAGANKLETELSAMREKLDQFDDELEQTENTLNQKLDTRADYLAGEDEYIKKSIERLSQALKNSSLDSIHRYVRATTSPTDDMLVIELQSVDNRLEDMKEDLNAVRSMHNSKIGRLKELEQVRRNFKNSRYDDVRSGFGNQALLSSVLSQFLQGLVSGSDVWRTIQRNQRYRNVGSLPDFGSGGLGDLLGGGGVSGHRIPRRTRPQRRSTWHWPTPRRGGGGFRIPSSGTSGGGGFKTGGGF